MPNQFMDGCGEMILSICKYEPGVMALTHKETKNIMKLVKHTRKSHWKKLYRSNLCIDDTAEIILTKGRYVQSPIAVTHRGTDKYHKVCES